MAIKEMLGKVALDRLLSKDGVPRYRTKKSEKEELERIKKKAKRKSVPKPKARKPKHKDIDFYEDVNRRERKNRGK